MYVLMIKTHRKTGLKYLCYTERENYLEYPGSGTYWRRHLRKHGHDIETEVLGTFEHHTDLQKAGRTASIFYDVVDSPNWANIRAEEGDGGDTVSRQKWITNGLLETYIPLSEDVPEGWRRGRADSCVFKNQEKQKELSSRSDREKAGRGTRLAWKAGRFANRPLPTSETKEKHRQNQLAKAVLVICPYCGREAKSGPWMNNNHFDRCKSKPHE